VWILIADWGEELSTKLRHGAARPAKFQGAASTPMRMTVHSIAVEKQPQAGVTIVLLIYQFI